MTYRPISSQASHSPLGSRLSRAWSRKSTPPMSPAAGSPEVERGVEPGACAHLARCAHDLVYW